LKIRTYAATVFDGMAKGLFASLIIGTIIKQIGVLTGVVALQEMGQLAQYMMGPCIGAGVAFARKAKQFTLASAIAAGALGAGTITFAAGTGALGAATIAVGEPLGACVAAVVALECANFLEGKTKFDLLLVPAASLLVAGLFGMFVSPVIAMMMSAIGEVVNSVSVIHPLPMGILLGVVVGVVLTLPISSAAMCIAIGIDGIAAGAALAGCCAQMIGFAVSSYRENKVSGLFLQGLGTSMLQVKNIIKNPWIWLPPTVASAVCGGLAATVFGMTADKVGAGMGTSGLVGQFSTFNAMGLDSLWKMGVLHVLIPAAMSLLLSELLRKRGLIKPGDMKL